ncbi:MAG: mannose-1-phosphate guanylyltransferase [Flavobacteriaceae bacterium]|nr:mannose-1-phosphate guanylyltransferase [Flavobacteriaceae bacterium]
MKNNYYAVIMAGGVGSRFWPVSTQENPKQFHDMLGTGKSLIQNTFERLEKLIPKKNILVATNTRYKNLVLEHLTEIDESQLLLEPAMRNTAPCVLYSAMKISNLNSDAVMVIAPSDHFIENEDEFVRNIKTAFDACKKQDILMTLGIKPSHPNTGYGYIKYELSSTEIKKVKNFTEKPNLEKAKQFLQEGDYLWNAGIFVWSVQSILKSFKESLPEMYSVLNQGLSSWNTPNEVAFIDENYRKCDNISIDYGIMERAKNVYILPVEFGWNDLGTWGSLYDKLSKDENNNVAVNAKIVFNNATGNIVRTQKGKKVIVQGLNNFIIVETEDTILILPKLDEQEIKQISAIATEKLN